MNLVKYILSVIFISALIVSCKTDPKDDASTGSMNTENTESSKNALTTNTKSVSLRTQDSLDIVGKMKTSGREVNPDEISAMLDKERSKSTVIPRVCNLLSEEDVAQAFSISSTIINESNGNRSQISSDNSKSCFWRWTEGGILVQISKNPFPEEVNDWGSRYMNSKKTNGEKTTSSADSRFTYKDFDGPGKYNIYNAELGRFYTSKDEDFIISLIFNGNYPERKKMQIAKELLTKVHNFL